MGQPAAKEGDSIEGTDTHVEMVQSGNSYVPTPLLYQFKGKIDGSLSQNVKVMGKPAATAGSTANNTTNHELYKKADYFKNPPSNKATINTGSSTVRINGKAAARNGDIANTCNDDPKADPASALPVDLPNGKVVASGTVMIG